MKTGAAKAGEIGGYREKRIFVEGGCSHLDRGSPIFRNYLAPILGEVSKWEMNR
jgi:hypothetical protein